MTGSGNTLCWFFQLELGLYCGRRPVKMGMPPPWEIGPKSHAVFESLSFIFLFLSSKLRHRLWMLSLDLGRGHLVLAQVSTWVRFQSKFPHNKDRMGSCVFFFLLLLFLYSSVFLWVFSWCLGYNMYRWPAPGSGRVEGIGLLVQGDQSGKATETRWGKKITFLFTLKPHIFS